MTQPLPWTFSADDPAGPDLENRLQEVLDVLAQQLPVTSLPVFGTNAHATLHGQYSVPFNLAAGTGAATTVSLGFTLPSMFMPVGGPNYSGGVSFQDTVTWAYKAAIGASTIEISLHNNGSGVAIGTFYFFVIAVG